MLRYSGGLVVDGVEIIVALEILVALDFIDALVVLVINSRGLGFYFNFVGERTHEPCVPTVIGLLKCRNKGGFSVGCLTVGGREMINSAKSLVALPSFLVCWIFRNIWDASLFRRMKS